MFWLCIAALLCATGAQQVPQIFEIEGIPLFGTDGRQGLRDALAGTTNLGALNVATTSPALPLSMRTVYRPWVPNPAMAPDPLFENFIITGVDLGNMGTGSVKLIDYSQTDCNLAGAATTALTRDAITLGSPQRAAYSLPTQQAEGVSITTLESQGYWICVAPAGGAAFIHTNLLYQVVPGCDATAGVLPTATSFPTTCAEQAALGPLTGVAATGVAAFPNVFPMETGINDVRFRERTRRTVCCGFRATNVQTNLPGAFGICINPDIESCCDSTIDARRTTSAALSAQNIGGTGKPFSRFREKCCFGGDEFLFSRAPDRGPGTPVFISRIEDTCPCALDDVERWCGAERQCCTGTKYPELLPRNAQGNPDLQFIHGRCFDSNTHKCCDTGEIYDPGTHQCCRINGLQSANVACPCGENTDCGPFQTCCAQRFPEPIPNQATCNNYLNYPSGQGNPVTGTNAREIPCTGQCIDTRYQMCCNGVACIDAYETCCNSTCCNRFNERCTSGLREGATNQPFNPRNYRIPFETCTRVEAMTPPRAILAYFIPLMLLLATYLGLAATLFFAKRINTFNPISGYEKLVYVLAVLAVLFAWPLFFSSIYKYGLVVAFGAFVCILAALSGIRPLMFVAIIVQAIVLLYLIDPFYGNELFTFAYHRAVRPDGVGFNGILHSIRQQWEDPQLLGDDRNQQRTFGRFPFHWSGTRNNAFRCTDYYLGLFDRDDILEDNLRHDNPEEYTFGLCSRNWITALLALSSILIIVSILLFVAVVIAAIKNVLVDKAVSMAPIPYY